jgi:quercetin dioxygenase-like cupin family protein
MSNFLDGCAAALALGILLAGCRDTADPTVPHAKDPTMAGPMFTMGSGSSSTLLGRAAFSDDAKKKIDVKRTTGDWRMELKSKPAFDVAVQSITFQPGGQSGWHTHPGPVFIQVVSGTMTFYQADGKKCTRTVRTAGQGYLDLGEQPHVAVNETKEPAQNVVTYFAPPGAALKIDADKPADCHI